eukprot:TRINITY_DN10199_c0_g1_i1.p1 TRINITY_DN10199_c0_g1~~TRINITY_DN10199_c0_g1_i1.p1  ORF type:complete len:311 (+),score=62.20 TRINITY_DN10199_c0_g1_i1:339-1271(+)
MAWFCRKRSRTDEDESSLSKRARLLLSDDANRLDPKVHKELIQVQNELMLLDEKCAEEQIKIQMRYDSLRKPSFKRRSTLLRKIPGFWQAALSGHPLGLVHPDEVEFLKQITDIDVKENLDKSCSYEVRIFFPVNAKDKMSVEAFLRSRILNPEPKSSVRSGTTVDSSSSTASSSSSSNSSSSSSSSEPRWFREQQIFKRVTFQDGLCDPAIVLPAKLTPIGQKGKQLLASLGLSSKSLPKPGSAAATGQHSVLGWLLSADPPNHSTSDSSPSNDLGDVLRRDLWQDPLPYYLSYVSQQKAEKGPKDEAE